MKQIKNIVVGVDFSECSASALAHAVRIAQWDNAHLHVVSVLEELVVSELVEASLVIPEVAQSDMPIEEALRQQTVRAIAEIIDKVVPKDQHPENIALEVRVGYPTVELTNKIKEVSADLVVLGTYGVSGPETGIGSVASKCIRKLPTKVLLIRESHADPFSNVVACIDFSETAQKVVEEAIRVAQQDDARLTFVHVYFGPWNRIHYMAPTREASPDFMNQYKSLMQAQMDQYLEQFEPLTQTMKVSNVLYEYANFGEGIKEFSKKVGADLLVLGTGGTNTLKQFFLGSTAERVVRNSPCSVLAIKPSGGKSEQESAPA